MKFNMQIETNMANKRQGANEIARNVWIIELLNQKDSNPDLGHVTFGLLRVCGDSGTGLLVTYNGVVNCNTG